MFLLHTKPLAKICNKIYVKQTVLFLYTEVCFIPHALTAYSKMRGYRGAAMNLLELSLRVGCSGEILKGNKVPILIF